MTKVRISTSRKNKMTDQYETDFSDFVDFIGKDSASKALQLKEKDRIKLGEVSTTNRYDGAKGVKYYNFACFSFETQDNGSSSRRSDDNPMYDGGSGEPDQRNRRPPY